MLAAVKRDLERRIGEAMVREMQVLDRQLDGLKYPTTCPRPDLLEVKKSIGKLLTLTSELQNVETTLERLETGLDELLAKPEPVTEPEAA